MLLKVRKTAQCGVWADFKENLFAAAHVLLSLLPGSRLNVTNELFGLMHSRTDPECAIFCVQVAYVHLWVIFVGMWVGLAHGQSVGALGQSHFPDDNEGNLQRIKTMVEQLPRIRKDLWVFLPDPSESYFVTRKGKFTEIKRGGGLGWRHANNSEIVSVA